MRKRAAPSPPTLVNPKTTSGTARWLFQLRSHRGFTSWESSGQKRAALSPSIWGPSRTPPYSQRRCSPAQFRLICKGIEIMIIRRDQAPWAVRTPLWYCRRKSTSLGPAGAPGLHFERSKFRLQGPGGPRGGAEAEIFCPGGPAQRSPQRFGASPER